MQTFITQLWEDRSQVTLTSYILHNSKEFHTNKVRPAVLVCPGGGYLFTSDREAEPVALRFASLGYQVFVLRYSVYPIKEPINPFDLPDPSATQFPQPLLDVAQAIKTIRDHAAEWFVDPNQIAVAGFSAGGHLAASIGAHWHEVFLQEKLATDSEYLKPNALILGYPMLDFAYMKKQFAQVTDIRQRGFLGLMNRAIFGTTEPTDEQLYQRNPINHVSEKMPPTFIWHTAEDDLIASAHSLHLATALAANQVPYELHIFEKGGHGLSMCDETTATEQSQIHPEVGQWFNMAVTWLKGKF